MNHMDRDKISTLRAQGMSYSQIASVLKLNENTVRSYCRRHRVAIPTPQVEGQRCPQCGIPVFSKEGKKPRRFCSDQCRQKYWNTHLNQVKRKAYYNITCQHCGRSFLSYGKQNRKYCSRYCFADARMKKGETK